MVFIPIPPSVKDEGHIVKQDSKPQRPSPWYGRIKQAVNETFWVSLVNPSSMTNESVYGVYVDDC